MFHVLFQVGAFAALAYDQELEIVQTAGKQIAFEIDQHAHIFFRPEPSDEPDPEYAVNNGPMFGREKLGIDAAGHYLRAAMRPGAEDRDQFLVRRQHHLGHLVVKDGAAEDLSLGESGNFGHKSRRKKTQHFREPVGGELVQVRMPGTEYRDLMFPAEISSDDAAVV